MEYDVKFRTINLYNSFPLSAFYLVSSICYAIVSNITTVWHII